MANQDKSDFLLGMLVGATVGAAIALLYAPTSGQETRQQMATAAGGAMERANEMAGGIKDKASDVAGRVKDQAQQMANRSSGGSAESGDNWAAQLPDQSGEDRAHHMDQHRLRVSDEPEVVAERVNNAAQGSGPEAMDIAEELAQAPTGRRSPTLNP